ncbi:acyloxyacyl hydrolase [Shimia thalassica]|uniref:acyloxyacyl hydrolase n=1 Tax=Shimia thalassica TaxID=1715693 RepID=UPI0027337716|nr:acyloxyacyl hydrolase [Shimia thalassica]MDP2492568.1 acyloxyacyl hydrolase [Shimia thalassica]
MKYVVLSALVAFSAAPVTAQEIVFGAGYTKYGNISASDAPVIELEYHHKPFHDTRHWDVSWGGVVSGTADEDYFLGIGLVGTYDFDSPWFAEVSVMPGLYSEGSILTDLGDALEFRSLLGVGYAFRNGSAVSLAIVHKSNASLGDVNPGVNTILLRYHKRF